MSTLPTFDQLTVFIRARPAATICEIRDHFGQQGEYTFTTNEGRKSRVIAYDINETFWRLLQRFMKQDCVIVSQNPLACLASDSTIYIGKLAFLPVVLTIQ